MLSDLLNSLQRDGAITEAIFLRSFAGILSGPVAFVTSESRFSEKCQGNMELLRHSRILKLGKFEIFSVNVNVKLGGYSKFPKEENFYWTKMTGEARECVFYGLFEWKKSAGHVERKIFREYYKCCVK